MKNSLPREFFQSYFAIFVLIITVHLKEREPEHKETPLELILGWQLKKSFYLLIQKSSLQSHIPFNIK